MAEAIEFEQREIKAHGAAVLHRLNKYTRNFPFVNPVCRNHYHLRGGNL
jgi:hypothetical protein